MAEPYPVFLFLDGKACLVVGGGVVAERKVDGLLTAGAAVTMVAPRLTARLRARALAGELRWRPRGFENSDLEGVFLAFVATSDPEVNHLAVQSARERGVWVNAADDPSACDFAVPAVLRRGRVGVAVSTGGSSPILAAWLRDRIAEVFPDALAALAEVAGGLRQSALARGPEGVRASRGLFDSGILGDLARQDWASADRKISRFFGSGTTVRGLLGRGSTEGT